MRKVTLNKIEATPDELHKFLMEQLQKFHKTKFTSIVIKDGLVKFEGEGTENVAELGTLNPLGINLIDHVFAPQEHGSEKRSVKNKGLSNWVREQLAGGVKAHLDHLLSQAGLKGYQLNKSYLRNQLRNIMAGEVTEVSVDVFMLTAEYKKTHNQTEESLTHS